MSYRDLLAQLLPPVAYSPDSKKLNAELTAEGNVFGTLENHAGQALDAVTPLFSHSLLADWERVLAITTIDGDSYQQRMQRVLAKLAETGGLSIPYFIRLASNLGYTITIDEPQPFRSGENRAGDRLWIPDIIWVWRVNIKNSGTQVYRFRAGSSVAGERLSAFGNQVIETIFNDLKPAYTFCYFAYQEND